MTPAVIAAYKVSISPNSFAWFAMDFGDFSEALSWLVDNLIDDDLIAQPIYAAINAQREDDEQIFNMLLAAAPNRDWFCVNAGGHQDRY